MGELSTQHNRPIRLQRYTNDIGVTEVEVWGIGTKPCRRHIERRFERTIRVKSCDAAARHNSHFGELAANQNLSVRLNSNGVDWAVSGSGIEGGVRTPVGIETDQVDSNDLARGPEVSADD